MTGRRRIGRREDNKIFDLPEDNDLLGSFEKALEDMEMTEKNKPAWVIDEEELNEQKMLQMYKTRNYKMKSPLEEDSECARQQEKILKKAENYRFSNPLMEEPAQVKRQIYAQKEKAQNYKFDNIFEAPPMSEKEKKKIAEYKMNPPFNSGYNYTEEPVKTAKKIAPGRQQTTRRPWEYGALPGEPPAAKPATCKPTKTTGFWPKPEATNEDLGIESSGDPILDSLRLQLKKHGASGITGLGRKFRIMDDDGSGCLCLDEFRKGMKELKLAELSDKAICHLFRYFDNDDSGSIDYDEFMIGVRGQMNARRLKLVKLAFLKIDKDRSGILDLNDVKGVYNARAHPDVMSGRRTEDEVLVEFINNFKIGGEKDGVVTPKEFEDYYANISASIDDDDYFELMMRNSWHISGGEGWCANTTNKRVLVTHDDGTQTVEEVKNDIGISSRDTDGMMRQLRSQGINAKTINTAGTSDMHNAKENNRGSNYSYVEDDRTAPMPQRLGEFANSYSRDNRAQRDSQRPSSTNKGGAYYKPQSLSEMIVNGNVPVTNQPRATSRGGYRR